MFKKIFLLGLACFCTFTLAQAQFRAGGGFTYGARFERPGAFGRAEFQIKEKLGIAATAAYYFPRKDGLLGVTSTRSAISADATYAILSNDWLDFYGIGGLNVLFFGTRVDGVANSRTNDTSLGFNVGGGIRYKLDGSPIVPIAEVRVANKGQNELIINLGVLYSF
jgi:opacity protein-like surface antigen